MTLSINIFRKNRLQTIMDKSHWDTPRARSYLRKNLHIATKPLPLINVDGYKCQYAWKYIIFDKVNNIEGEEKGRRGLLGIDRSSRTR